jgi:hypothetical protein
MNAQEWLGGSAGPLEAEPQPAHQPAGHQGALQHGPGVRRSQVARHCLLFIIFRIQIQITHELHRVLKGMLRHQTLFTIHRRVVLKKLDFL